MEYYSSVDVKIVGQLYSTLDIQATYAHYFSKTVPHFVHVDQLVFSHVGDLLTLTCLPNITVATVIWLKT